MVEENTKTSGYDNHYPACYNSCPSCSGYLRIPISWSWTGLSKKTLWDWLQLLIIPAVIALGGYLFTFTTSRNERDAADRHNQTEREIAQDNQREAALQEYIDKMSELLLHEKLGQSQPEDKVRKIAH